MPAKEPWTEKFDGHGIYTFDLRGWNDFQDLISYTFCEHKNYIWRGQRCSNWKLTSTLFRNLKKDNPARHQTLTGWHFKEFQYAARGRRGANPPEISEDDWWALGQHYGLATPLLDWTASPFAAAYFAFCHTGDPQSPCRAVYALNHRQLEVAAQQSALKAARDFCKKNGINADDSYIADRVSRHQEIKVIRPLSNENPRLVNQAGLFTKIPLRCSLCDWIRESIPKDTTGKFLVRITIPDADREKCLRALNRMNINHLTLFPELGGAAEFCNMHLDVTNY